MLKLFKATLRGERGSALLVSLMVMVGLSLLGLGFVAISETENLISLNHRNTAQTQALAEAGARAVVEWFQRPEWAAPLGIMPADSAAHDAAFKFARYLDPDGANPNPPAWQPKIKMLATDVLFCCDKPFKPAITDRFYGTETASDIVIDRSTAEGQTFLDAFNTKLFKNNDGGQVTEIRIYAPPIIDGNVNVENFWDNNVGQRYGLATIKVTAQKGSNANPSAQRSVKIVISEWPFPGPQGPIQSNANLQTGGNVAVHWGKMTAQGTMFVKRPLVGLPWYDPYERVHLEQGYDSATSWVPNRGYYKGEIVRSALGDDWEVIAPGGPTNSGFIPPSFPIPAMTPVGTVFNDFINPAITWRKRQITRWPNSNTNTYNRPNYMYELLTAAGSLRDFDDPWIECRSFGAITNAIIASAAPHPFKYLGVAADEIAQPTAGFSNWFQNQNMNDDDGIPGSRPKKQVIFPKIDYDFWKNTAISGQGNEGVYYLTWVSGEIYRDSAGVQKNFAQWTNIVTGRPRGFYFFDTTNNQSPQGVGGSAFLTPTVEVNSSDDGMIWMMSGFIYLNSTSFGTQGIRGPGGRFNFPGEPYRDLGYRRVAAGGPPYALEENPPASGAYVIDGQGDGRWNYQEVNGNSVFDLFLEERQVVRPGDDTVVTVWLPKLFFNGCTPGTGGVNLAGVTTGAGNCSEPFEPYLNITYPQDACCGGGGAPNPMNFQWQNPAGTVDRRPKKQLADNSWPAVDASDFCTTAAQFEEYCTSNKYDRDGYADDWTGTNAEPVLDGVFYNEGDFNPTGNARYFGSLLINGNVDSTGTNEVWFDERLIKDEWPPKSWPFPRVIITAVETDN